MYPFAWADEHALFRATQLTHLDCIHATLFIANATATVTVTACIAGIASTTVRDRGSSRGTTATATAIATASIASIACTASTVATATYKGR